MLQIYDRSGHVPEAEVPVGAGGSAGGHSGTRTSKARRKLLLSSKQDGCLAIVAKIEVSGACRGERTPVRIDAGISRRVPTLSNRPAVPALGHLSVLDQRHGLHRHRRHCRIPPTCSGSPSRLSSELLPG